MKTHYNSKYQKISIISEPALRERPMGSHYELQQSNELKFKVNVRQPLSSLQTVLLIAKWVVLFLGPMVVLCGGYIGWYYYKILHTEQYQLIEMLPEVKELPFCFLLFPSSAYSASILRNSVQTQNYTNYEIVSDSQSAPPPSYFDFKRQIEEQCPQYSVVMFVNSPLKIGAVGAINDILQHFRVWVVYGEDPKGNHTEVFAFYYRIYELLGSNDFQGTNSKYLEQNNREVQALSLLELSQKFKYKVDPSLVKSEESLSYFSYSHANIVNYQRKEYQRLLRLSQDYKIYVKQFQISRFNLFYNTLPIFFGGEGLNLLHILKAKDREQLIYLPKNHTVEVLEREQMNRKYQINAFNGKEQQSRFCVTVLSHNNKQNNRWIKVLRSILQQEYENYHIVFFDDNSTEGTMKETIEYMDRQKFPRDRIRYVQNLQRNFATYSIINAAYNFCGKDDIQLLIDGDDEIIGRYAFQVINAHYRANDQLWIVYSNFKNNYYLFGFSQSLKKQSQLIRSDGKRAGGFWFGPIRTWRVQLIHSMPYEHHKHSDGTWLDTSYDNAIILSISERSGIERIKYIKQIFYQYNVNYGDNDNSSNIKLARRLEVYTHIKSHKPLERFSQLSECKKDERVTKQLNQGLGVRYKLVDH